MDIALKRGAKLRGIFLRSGDMSAMTKDDQAALLRQGFDVSSI